MLGCGGVKGHLGSLALSRRRLLQNGKMVFLRRSRLGVSALPEDVKDVSV
jgi:hypothetical protein